MFGLTSNPLEWIFGILALILAIDVHEFSHAWVADHLGDPLPRSQGRLTLNPLAHLDPIGTIALIIIGFGWGKPVQFDPFNLRHVRRDSAIISFAGAASNLILAVICSIILRVPIPTLLALFIFLLLRFNIILAIFNLVPIHPLDGFKIVEGILPEQQAHEWHELERYGMIFLLVLLLPIFGGGVAPIQRIISPVINFLLTILLPGAPVI